MPQPQIHLLRPKLLLSAAFCLAAALPGASPVFAQRPGDRPGATAPALPGVSKQADSLKAGAYYHFALGHLYEELAGTYGNRNDYVNKAIDNYRQAMKDDPNASFLVQDVAELYRMSGRIREAVEEAQGALKTNPNDLNARRVLARIYTQQIGDAQTNHVDENMARKAIEQYKMITDKEPSDTDSLVMMARLQKLLGDSVGAETSFKKVLSADADNEDAITGLAGVYSDRNNPKAASELLEKLATKNPSPRALVALANLYEQMRQYSEAAETYAKALELDPSRAELKAAMAQDQALAGHYDDALKTYQQVADANPQEAEPYLGMSQVYREQKKFDQAHQMIAKAKELEPDNVDIKYNEVILLQQEGKLGDAVAAMKGLLDATGKKSYNAAERGTRAEMLDKYGTLLRSNQQIDQAVDAFRQELAVNPDFGSRAEVQIVESYRAGKDFAKAEAESEAAYAKFPKDRMVTQVRAEVLSDQGKTDQAVALLKPLLDGKDDLRVYLAIAETYQQGKNFPEMSKALESADRLSPDKDDAVQIAFMRGAMYEREKKYELAEKEFRRVIDADPSNASALNYLGYMLADQGVRLQEAQDLIKRAVDLDPNNYAFLDSLGWVYYHQNRLNDAEQQLTQSLRMMSTDPTIHDHLGDVYFKQGKLKEAIDQWQASLKAWNTSSPAEQEPEEVAKVQKKMDGARVRLAKGQGPGSRAN
jgi:tetratricopeptide (TPR) repeat protein